MLYDDSDPVMASEGATEVRPVSDVPGPSWGTLPKGDTGIEPMGRGTGLGWAGDAWEGGAGPDELFILSS